MKNKNAIRRAAKSKRKSIKVGTKPWKLKPKLRLNSIINYHIKKSLYDFIINQPQIVKSPIVNDCLKVNIDGRTIP